MYWDGDGVPKDHANSARWFQIADAAGEARAAKFLGDYAFVQVTNTLKPDPRNVDRSLLDEAIQWYDKALKIEPDPAAKAEAQQRQALLLRFKRALAAQ